MVMDKETFRLMADMIKLEFSEKEEKLLFDHLNKTIEFIDTMNELDTDSTEPFTFVYPKKNTFREDVVDDRDINKDLISGAPDICGGYFVVPKSIE
jgi:glutamyl-tRNA(Gln) and/or aspartyl-tRNA(Asn) amidotransferase, C subunit